MAVLFIPLPPPIYVHVYVYLYEQEALLTVTARVPDTEQYRDFSDEVKRIAHDEFNYTYDEDPVNPFVAAFHEAVLLYAIVRSCIRQQMS